MKKRVITKILKLDENNQYRYGITKPLPTGWIEENLEVTWRTFNLLKVSLDDQIGHHCVVDIKLDHRNPTENWIAYNEIYPPIIEQRNIIDLCERSVYQLFEQYSAIEKGNP